MLVAQQMSLPACCSQESAGRCARAGVCWTVQEMFRSRIDDSVVAGYTSVIAVPMSLDTIK